MQIKNIGESEFISYENEEYEVMFSTAAKGTSYNIAMPDTKSKLDDLAGKLNLDKISYLKQIHSDKIVLLKKDDNIQGQVQGDAIITNLDKLAIGIFTADCVPVIVVDTCNHVIAAIHSGWKGTINNIVGKTIMKMQTDFQCKVENLKIFIGPHNKVCCYEVSEELIMQFKSKDMFENQPINQDRYLNLEQCIIVQCANCGILEQQITRSDYCTFCSTNPIFHSYRKDKEKSGRQISLTYLK